MAQPTRDDLAEPSLETGAFVHGRSGSLVREMPQLRSGGRMPAPDRTISIEEAQIRAEALELLCDAAEVDLWFSAPNANFGGRSPASEIEAGGSANVRHLIDTLRYVGIS